MMRLGFEASDDSEPLARPTGGEKSATSCRALQDKTANEKCPRMQASQGARGSGGTDLGRGAGLAQTLDAYPRAAVYGHSRIFNAAGSVVGRP